MDGLRYSPDDPYYRLGPVHTCLYVRACRLVSGTSSYPLEWAREETGGVTARHSHYARVNFFLKTKMNLQFFFLSENPALLLHTTCVRS